MAKQPKTILPQNTYGELNVTDEELATAKAAAFDAPNPFGEEADQLVRYCIGRSHTRTKAKSALKKIREAAATTGVILY